MKKVFRLLIPAMSAAIISCSKEHSAFMLKPVPINVSDESSEGKTDSIPTNKGPQISPQRIRIGNAEHIPG
ncbi:MAG TPA: hypothetical protein PKM63_14060 [Panacibacter sp.]|nr:hypothetical protein [Panacibacter sp.]HNP45410.1 hypothetical protein [Panacibacter sp.]